MRRLLTVLLVACTVFALPGVPASAALIVCEAAARSPYSTTPGTFHTDAQPLVLIHGWTGNSDGMYPVELGLEQRVPGTFDFRYFDYRTANTDWASSPRIAACLAEYIHAVSQAHRASGGDGRVYVAAHSMGGLAIRFATDGRYASPPVTSDELAGVITIDTPHLGSPFGNTYPGAGWEHLNELGDRNLLPVRASDAVHCLAVHSSTVPLPSDCAKAPYLPVGTPIMAVTGDSSVRRTLFGQALYDIDLTSDGVVNVPSGTDYLGSGPIGDPGPQGEQVSARDVRCLSSSDETMLLLKGLVPPTPVSIIKAELAALGSLWIDDRIVDQVNSGEQGPELAVMRLVAALTSPCGHGSMLSHPEALDSAADALKDWTIPKVVFGGYGSVAAGATAAEVRAAAPQDAEVQDLAHCELIGIPETYQAPNSAGYVIRRDSGLLIGVYPPADAITAAGIGPGASPTEIRAAYPDADFEWVFGHEGTQWVALVSPPTNPDLAIGFAFGESTSSGTPGDDDRSTRVTAGTRDFASGFEVCSG